MVVFLEVMAAVSVVVVAVQFSCLFGYETSKNVVCRNDQVGSAQQLIVA